MWRVYYGHIDNAVTNGMEMAQHRKWYAIRATDIMGNRRHWADYYRTAKDACKDAKQLRNDHPLGWIIEVLVETVPVDGSQIGSNWSHFRTIK